VTYDLDFDIESYSGVTRRGGAPGETIEGVTSKCKCKFFCSWIYQNTG